MLSSSFHIDIDTSSNSCQVVLARGSEVLEFISGGVGNHLEIVPVACQDLMSRHSVTKSMLDYVGVVLGPGGFTGLRIGVTYASVLAGALGVPVVGLSALELKAMCGSEVSDGVLVVDDAKRGEIFFGLFTPSTKAGGYDIQIEGNCPPEGLVGVVDNVLERTHLRSGNFHVTGNALGKYQDRLGLDERWIPLGPCNEENYCRVMADRSYMIYDSGGALDPKSISVHYIREADAKKNFRTYSQGRIGGPS